MTVIPAAFTSLTSIMTTALPDVAVIAGRTPSSTWTKPAYLFVGCDDPTNQGAWQAVENGQREWEGMPAISQKETFRIWMSLLLSSGKSDGAPLIALATTYMAAIETALRPAPVGTGNGQLGTALQPTGWCVCGFVGFQQGMNQNGAYLTVPVVVDCVNYDNT